MDLLRSIYGETAVGVRSGDNIIIRQCEKKRKKNHPHYRALSLRYTRICNKQRACGCLQRECTVPAESLRLSVCQWIRTVYHLVLVNSAYCNIQVSRIFGLGVQALSLSGPRDPADLAICRLSEYKQLRLRGHLFPNVWALLPQACINQLSQYEPR